MIGQKFGRLTVSGGISPNWECTCDCGNITTVLGSTLRKGDKRSCGCASRGRDLVDMTGWVIGNITVLRQGPSYLTSGGNSKTRWVCRCICGREYLSKTDKLRSKNPPMSCGCNRETTIEGQLYLMKKRKAGERDLQFTLKLDEFLELIIQDCHYCGKPPSNCYKLPGNRDLKYSGLDRKHNDHGYIPGNCLPCCWHCNSMKLDLSYEDFIEKIRLLHNRLC